MTLKRPEAPNVHHKTLPRKSDTLITAIATALVDEITAAIVSTRRRGRGRERFQDENYLDPYSFSIQLTFYIVKRNVD
jgi:hypothetical protein